ncbi:hypothetical protein Shyhy01_70540 [Streptomyces hygroscopicus subsp. hygroscopicus]|nr:hypothetical protein Shyhy01_70540 [Streptomyces hygroscopicus subsp. hygroscopicus]
MRTSWKVPYAPGPVLGPRPVQPRRLFERGGRRSGCYRGVPLGGGRRTRPCPRTTARGAGPKAGAPRFGVPLGERQLQPLVEPQPSQM